MTTATPSVRPALRLPARPVPAGVVTGLVVVPVAAAAGVGTAVSPGTALVATAVLALAAAVALHPPLAAYLLIGVTPLVVGIDRGVLVPLLRPHEALLALCAAALVVRGVWELRSGARPSVRLGPVAVVLVVMAACNSVVPLLWMALRHRPISVDDLSYAAVLWKFLALYAVVRCSVRTDAQVARCLRTAMGVGAVVAVVAILQSLQLFGVDDVLHGLYAPFGDTSVVSAGRGSATLGLAVATGDLMIFNLALAAGFWRREPHRAWLLAPLALLFVAGAVSAGQFSTAFGLVVAIAVLGVVFRRADVPIVLGVAGVGAGLVLAPVVATRLAGFAGASGLPESWVGRLDNLRGYFWPRLLADHQYLLGVQPSARVPSPSTLALPWIWIESGYTWLFWGGGVPLFAAFAAFVCLAVRRGLPLARGPGARGVAATGVVVAVVVVAVLMIFDPHVTYRGSADLLFALLALVAARGGDEWTSPSPSPRPRIPADPPVPTTEVEP